METPVDWYISYRHQGRRRRSLFDCCRSFQLLLADRTERRLFSGWYRFFFSCRTYSSISCCPTVINHALAIVVQRSSILVWVDGNKCFFRLMPHDDRRRSSVGVAFSHLDRTERKVSFQLMASFFLLSSYPQTEVSLTSKGALTSFLRSVKRKWVRMRLRREWSWLEVMWQWCRHNARSV